MNKWRAGRLLASFTKSSSEDVRLTLHDWGIGKCLDIRIWARIRPGDSMPTQPADNGLVLDVDLLPDLRRAIDAAIIAVGGDNATEAKA